MCMIKTHKRQKARELSYLFRQRNAAMLIEEIEIDFAYSLVLILTE